MGINSPYDQQPIKAIYVAARISALTVLLPVWSMQAIFSRPRASWTVKETTFTRMIHWLMPLNADCGLAPLVLDKTKEVPQSKLKETSFVWLDPLPGEFVHGIAQDDKVKPVRIPGYIWPKQTPLSTLTSTDDLVCLWIHGGGYMMGNGSESFAENSGLFYRTSVVSWVLSDIARLIHKVPATSKPSTRLMIWLANQDQARSL